MFYYTSTLVFLLCFASEVILITQRAKLMPCLA